jgi:D-alanyl-D-alanine carboxypeptidase
MYVRNTLQSIALGPSRPRAWRPSAAGLGQAVDPGRSLLRPLRLGTLPKPMGGLSLAAAVALNEHYRTTLGWGSIYSPIVSWILGLSVCPTPESFANVVANWQQQNCLPMTGTVDFETWSAMLWRAKTGIPKTFQTPEGIARPRGLRAILQTFGDPTQRNWERHNIVEASAPSGRKFDRGRTTMRVHRLLKPHFERLFAAINRAGLWAELAPPSGTFYCRIKKSHGKKKCTAAGVRSYQLSTHSWGITIDVRASDYPLYTDEMQHQNEALKLPPERLASIFQDHGFHWGLWFMKGDELTERGRINFSGADQMHFQFATGY